MGRTMRSCYTSTTSPISSRQACYLADTLDFSHYLLDFDTDDGLHDNHYHVDFAPLGG